MTIGTPHKGIIRGLLFVLGSYGARITKTTCIRAVVKGGEHRAADGRGCRTIVAVGCQHWQKVRRGAGEYEVLDVWQR